MRYSAVTDVIRCYFVVDVDGYLYSIKIELYMNPYAETDAVFQLYQATFRIEYARCVS